MDASGGSREKKYDDHESNRRKRSFDFKNVEESDKKSSDDVPQSSDQMEVVEDATGGRGRMFGNNYHVVENSNGEFIASQMDIRGSVGVVDGQFGNELSANRDTWNQRKRPRGPNTGNTGSSSHGTALDRVNLLGQSTSGTQLVLPSESSNGLDQGQGQGNGGTASVLHSESSSRNVHGLGQQGMHSQLVSPTATQYTYQRGRFRVTTYEQPSANPGFFSPMAVQEHNMRVQSDHNIAGRNVPRLRGPAVQLGSNMITYQRGRFRVTCEQPSGNPGFFMPRGVQEHNMRCFFGTPMNPFFPTFASQNVGLPVARPPVHMGMLLNANMDVEDRGREEVVSDQGSNSEDV